VGQKFLGLEKLKVANTGFGVGGTSHLNNCLEAGS